MQNNYQSSGYLTYSTKRGTLITGSRLTCQLRRFPTKALTTPTACVETCTNS